MRRWLVRLLLIALLPWHGAGWLTAALAAEHHDEARHAVAHWLGEAHHHHDHGDGGFHHDDSDESVLHMVHTNAQMTPAAVLPTFVDCIALDEAVDVPHGISLSGCPHPFLEGPDRPPRRIG